VPIRARRALGMAEPSCVWKLALVTFACALACQRRMDNMTAQQRLITFITQYATGSGSTAGCCFTALLAHTCA
jgi:FtsH-binding integral membrane protein